MSARRRSLDRKCECGAPKWKHSAGVGVCIEARCACGVFRPAKLPRKHRETPEQKARRVGPRLDFYLRRFRYAGKAGHWEKWDYCGRVLALATDHEIALWRALARKMGVRI